MISLPSQEDEPEHYNAFLRELRAAHEGGKRDDLWSLIKEFPRGALTLISSDECAESAVPPAEAERFFSAAAPEPEPMHVDSPESEPEDDLDELLV